jgi:NTE family protein
MVLNDEHPPQTGVRSRHCWPAAIAIWTFGSLANAQQPVLPPSGEPRPRVCLVLSGGGARGIAHVGVLRVLEEMHVPIDCIAGTSMGAIVGGLYSAGYSPDELDAIVHETPWSSLLRDTPERQRLPYRRKVDDLTYLTRWEFGFDKDGIKIPPSLVAGHRMGALLHILTLRAGGVSDFDKLPVPFRAVATDATSGEAVVMGQGDLGVALRASAAIPGLFAPVELNGRNLVDGGLVDNLPIDAALTLRADVIIAVDLGQPMPTRGRPNSMIRALTGSVSALTRREVERALAKANIIVRPKVGEYALLDFDAVDALIKVGDEATEAQADALLPYAVDDVAWNRYLTSQRRSAPTLMINSVKIDADSPSKARLERRLTLRSGQPLDSKALAEELDRIWESDDFETVNFSLVPAPSDTWDLDIAAQRKSWGPNFLRFGITLASDLEGESSFNLLGAATMTELNTLGAEFKFRTQIGDQTAVGGEWYQPLAPSRIPFAALGAYAARNKAQVIVGPDLVQYRYTTLGADADLGLSFGRYGEMRVGAHFVEFESHPTDDHTGAPSDTHDDAGYRVRLAFDQLDRINFPRKGVLVAAEYYETSESLGSDEDYRRATLQVVSAGTIGRHTLIGILNSVSALGGTLPLDAQIELGGLFNLSGLPIGEVRGNYGGVASLIYTYRLGRLPNFVDGMYVGGSFETGNAWMNSSDVDFHDLRKSYSAVFGVDTYVGPVYLAYGRSTGGKDSFYLYLGRSF